MCKLFARHYSFLFLATIVLLNNCQPATTLSEEPVDLVFPLLDTENSRWFFFSSACRPFGMVNLSPDTETAGAWGSGYRFNTDTVKGFSHIHAWQLSGLSVMPVDLTNENKIEIGTNYYSHFDHKTEVIAPGYHQLELTRYGIKAELTSTKRVGFHKYEYKHSKKWLIIDVGGKLGPSLIEDGSLEKKTPRMFTGQLVNAPTMRRPHKTKVFFKIEFNQDIEQWEALEAEGKYLLRVKQNDEKSLLMKVAISYTSADNAAINMDSELPHWDFLAVTKESKDEWNDHLGKIKVEGSTREVRARFYTDLWHALQGRRVISDINGYYPDYTRDQFQIKRLPLNNQGNPLFNHYNSDSFWGAQWTINTLWPLVYPEIAVEFTHSLLQYYKDGGIVPRGPAGGNYTYVMTGASSTPFMVSTVQKIESGLSDSLVYEALKKNHMPGGIMEKSGYEHLTNKGGGLAYYIEQGYVPYPIPEGKFGLHQDGASLTLEYAYQDWVLAQMAIKLGKDQDAKYFLKRSKNYLNLFDSTTNWIRPKDQSGRWKEPFDPYEYENGFNESNGAQSCWFVPHDLDGLAGVMGGKSKTVEKLNAQFIEAQKLGFTSGTSHDRESHPEFARIPINYGNQPSIQTAFIFNHLDRPDLTQYWSRQIVNNVYDGLQTNRGYNGDEDQGLMGSLSVLMKMGLFQMNGGTTADPTYEIGSPIFDKITINLNPKYYDGNSFVIETVNNSNTAFYIKEKWLNDTKVNSFEIHHSDIVNGGKLTLQMTNKPVLK